MSLRPFTPFKPVQPVVAIGGIPNLAPWNPADKVASVVLTGSNYTGQGSAVGYKGVRCVSGRAKGSGPVYFEFFFPDSFNYFSEALCGIKLSTESLTNFNSSATIERKSASLFGTRINGGGSATRDPGHTITPDTRCRVAFNPATGKWWFGYGIPANPAGVWFLAGDPAAGTGEISTISMAEGSIWHKFGIFSFADSLVKRITLCSQPLYPIPGSFNHWSL